DDDGIRNRDRLAVDGEDECVFVDVVVARVDGDAALAELIGGELRDRDLRAEGIGDGDRGERRDGLLEELSAGADEADVLERVLPFLVQRGEDELMSRFGAEGDGVSMPGPVRSASAKSVASEEAASAV